MDQFTTFPYQINRMDNIGFKGLFIKERIALNFKAMWPLERPFFRQNHFNQSDLLLPQRDKWIQV